MSKRETPVCGSLIAANLLFKLVFKISYVFSGKWRKTLDYYMELRGNKTQHRYARIYMHHIFVYAFEI